tara:strand:+ start:50 stop:424 length:375 start_codon:yes stop_codon:yes gene_type:complete
MIFRLLRILVITSSFFFLTGFMPLFSIVGPSMTALTSGNVYKAGAQFFINQSIEKQTGKTSLTLVKDEINKKIQKKSVNDDLRKLVEKRIKITRQTIENQNLQKLIKKRINVTRSIIKLNKTTQ